MTRIQFIVLNTLAGLFSLLLVLKVLLLLEMGSYQRKILVAQATVTQAQRSEPLLRELAVRLAQASVKEPDLADLLKQHNLRVSLSKAPNTPQ